MNSAISGSKSRSEDVIPLVEEVTESALPCGTVELWGKRDCSISGGNVKRNVPVPEKGVLDRGLLGPERYSFCHPSLAIALNRSGPKNPCTKSLRELSEYEVD